MSKLLMLVACAALACPPVPWTSATAAPAARMDAAREYRGKYENHAYHYGVTLPRGVVGRDGNNPAYQQGFIISLSHNSRINVFGNVNSLEFSGACEPANFYVENLPSIRRVVSRTTLDTRLGTLAACQVDARYLSKPSGKIGRLVAITALSADRRFVYHLVFDGPALDDPGKATLDALKKSWRNI